MDIMSKQKPKFQIGQIVILRWFVPPVFLDGERVAVLEVVKQNGDYRYKVEQVDYGKEQGWIDEGYLIEPLADRGGA
jgi:hypothetical protein